VIADPYTPIETRGSECFVLTECFVLGFQHVTLQ
jgi:hypothetical protein